MGSEVLAHFEISCVCFEKFLFNFVVTLVSVLKSVTKLFLKNYFESICVKEFLFCFEQVLKISYLLEKGCSFSRFF